MIKFSCPKCGCERFTLVRETYLGVDFSQEGAVEGHPLISSGGNKFSSFQCTHCREEVPTEQAEKMLKEVI